MTWFAVGATVIWAVLLCLITVVQILYMESLRLRSRDLPALQFFKETLEDRIGVKGDDGVLAFSLIKHTLVLLLGVCFLATRAGDPSQRLAESVRSGAVRLAHHAAVHLCSGPGAVPQNQRALAAAAGAAAALVRAAGAAADRDSRLLPVAGGTFRARQQRNEEGPGPSGDIEALISAGEEEGIIEKDDRKLIESVVAFGDKTVREVMTPRPKIVAIEANRSLEDLRELVIHEQYSRIPVYEDTIDNIIGFVHVRDMFELDEADRQGRRVKELTRPIRFVPETKPVNDLLREMQQDGAHMAIVIDEYGNTAGLATMEDMVEEILGEIHDEHEPERDVLKQPDGSFVVSGSLDLDRLHDLLEFRPPEETESTTIGGLVTEWLGHVPHIGEVIERDGIRMEVLAGDELKVEQVRVSKVAHETVPETHS